MLALALAAQLAGSFTDCERQFAANPERDVGPRCFYTVAVKENRFDAAIARLEQLLRQHPDNPWLAHNLANLRFHRGEDAALYLYRRAATGYAGRDDRSEVNAHGMAADFLRRRGRFEEAAAEVDAATRVGEVSGDRIARRLARFHRADHLYVSGGDLSEAYRLAREVEASVFPDASYPHKIRCLALLSGTTKALGRLEESLTYLERALELAQAEGDAFSAADMRQRAVATRLEIIRARGDGSVPPEIVAELRATLAAGEAADNRLTVIDVHRQLGELTEGEEARRHFEACIQLSGDKADLSGLAPCERGLAVLRADRDPEGAFAALGDLLVRARRNGEPDLVAGVHTWVAALRWRTGPRDRAIADSWAMLDAIEASRDRQRDAEARGGLGARYADDYGWFASRALGGPDGPRVAFAVLERLRGRALLELLDGARATAALTPTGPAALARDGVLGDIVAAQRKLMSDDLGDAERVVEVRRLEALERREAELRAEMAKGDTRFAALRAPVLATLDDVAATLAPDEALLSYYLVPRGDVGDRSGVIVVTRGAARAVFLPERRAVDSATKLFLGLVERRDGAERAAAARLHALLLAPALAQLPAGVTQLVIIPDGPLHRLPFAALRAAPDAPPLSARYRVSVAPSATLWRRWRTAERRSTPELALVLADPALANERTASATREWAFATAVALGALPHARDEAAAIADELGGKVLVGAEASEAALKRADLARFRAVHLAAHALVDDSHPERSAVVLAPGTAAEDGLMQIREIVGLPLDGQLVVLSACRSAAGAEQRGEGIIGLARAFFVAGARTVVGSLWPLRDDEAAALFAAFYRRLARGETVAASLAGAQEELWRVGAPAAAWAGAVVLGDGRLVLVPGGVPLPWWPYLVAGVGLALAGIAVAALIRRRLTYSARRRRPPSAP